MKTRLETLCEAHGQQGGTIHEFNRIHKKALKLMSLAMDKKTFSKDSSAWKLTCKALGIKHTYKEIFSYIGES